MKEISIEEKAKLYDELKVKAQELTEDGYIDKLALVDMFPELKESEDEKMRKVAIEFVKQNNSFNWLLGVSKEQVLDWLEKQGEHANFRNKIQIGDKVTRNEDGVLVNLSQLNRVAKKQGEQKLYVNDNAKEMFIKALERVEEQNAKGYKLTDCDKNSWWEDFKNYTSCTIEQKPTGWSEKLIADVFEMVGLAKIVREQENDALTRALQFAMIELAKYSVVPQIRQEWSEEDEYYLNSCITKIEIDIQNWEGHGKTMIDVDKEIISWLKSLKDRVQPQPKQEWSEKYIADVFEKVGLAKIAREQSNDNLTNALQDAMIELSKFTLQPNPAWSEEDEVLLKLSVENLTELKDRYGEKYGRVGECIDWLESKLESFKPQNTWKPCDEQMETLEYYMHTLVCNSHKETLFSLYQDLKKLRGE